MHESLRGPPGNRVSTRRSALHTERRLSPDKSDYRTSASCGLETGFWKVETATGPASPGAAQGRQGKMFLVGKNGAVERTRTSTVLLPPAPQAGASASSATTARQDNFPIIVEPSRNCEAALKRAMASSVAQALVANLPEAAVRGGAPT